MTRLDHVYRSESFLAWSLSLGAGYSYFTTAIVQKRARTVQYIMQNTDDWLIQCTERVLFSSVDAMVRGAATECQCASVLRIKWILMHIQGRVIR